MHQAISLSINIYCLYFANHTQIMEQMMLDHIKADLLAETYSHWLKINMIVDTNTLGRHLRAYLAEHSKDLFPLVPDDAKILAQLRLLVPVLEADLETKTQAKALDTRMEDINTAFRLMREPASAENAETLAVVVPGLDNKDVETMRVCGKRMREIKDHLLADLVEVTLKQNALQRLK